MAPIGPCISPSKHAVEVCVGSDFEVGGILAGASVSAAGSQQITRTYMPHVDGLRAVAVMAVLFHHLGVPGFGGGFVGVDIFLVISGFLISRNLFNELASTNTIDFAHFYARRIRRLSPALICVLCCTLGATSVLSSPEMRTRTCTEAILAVSSVSNIYFWKAADYFDVESLARPLLHTWSLSLEEQFYLVWPGVLFLAWRFRIRLGLPGVLWGLGAVSLAMSALSTPSLSSWAPVDMDATIGIGKPALFYLLPFRVFEFAIGGLLAWHAREQNGKDGIASRTLERSSRFQRAIIQGAAFSAGLACVAASVLTYNKDTPFPSFLALLPCVGAALCIWCGGNARCRFVLTNPVLVWIGRVSYSLYLVHWPLIVFTVYVVGDLDGPQVKAFLGLASLGCGALLNTVVERPALRTLWPLWRAGLACAGLVCVCVAMLKRDATRPVAVGLSSTNASTSNPFSVNLPVANGEVFKREFYGGAGYSNGVYGQGPIRIVLTGDSHGMHYADAISKLVCSKHNMSMQVYVETSSLVLPGIVRFTGEDGWHVHHKKCLKKLNETLAHVQPQPVVVLGQFWLTQSKLAYMTDDEGRKVPRALTPEDMVAGLVRLQKFAQIKKLIVIGQTPVLPMQNLYDDLTRPERFQRAKKKFNVRGFACDPQIVKLNAALTQGAQRTGAFKFIDPLIVFQNNGACVAADERGDLLFVDRSHLSQTGSRAVIGHYADYLSALIQMPW